LTQSGLLPFTKLSMDFYPALRPLLFSLPPETAHQLTLWALDLAALWPTKRKFLMPREVMGLKFPNPIGLAAGLDKNGDHIRGLAALGFGFIEVGTVTPRPQAGNPKPRLFRLQKAQALINRMGFNNQGVEHLVENLTQFKEREFLLGVNVGKNRATPLAQAAKDYCFCLERVYPLADYVAINLSSPNTPGLRELQFGPLLKALLTELGEARDRLRQKTGKFLPLAVKIAPDLTFDQLAAQAEVFLSYGVDAVIATNTTVDHRAVAHLPHGQEAGGVSGKPLAAKSTAIVRALCPLLQGKIPIIACGGITSAADALAKFEAGASLIQLYTGLIYRGPKLIEEIFTHLQKLAGNRSF
jgi:dihydroorotate dehydrogenase